MSATGLFRRLTGTVLLLVGCITSQSANAGLLIPFYPGATPAAEGATRLVGSVSTFPGQELRRESNLLLVRLPQQRTRFDQLLASAKINSADYLNFVGSINARLETGAAAGDPRLLELWTRAQGKIEQLALDTGGMAAVAAEVNSGAATAASIRDRTRTMLSSRNLMPEQQAMLRQVEADVIDTAAGIERLLNELTPELARRTAFLETERRNLQVLSLAIAKGEPYGQSLANRIPPNRTAPNAAGLSLAGAGPSAGPPADLVFIPVQWWTFEGLTPLVTIWFDKDDADYEQPLYRAIGRAIERFPEAQFELAAITPARTIAAKGRAAQAEANQHTAAVYRTLLQFGVPAERMRLTSSTSGRASAIQTRIYLR